MIQGSSYFGVNPYPRGYSPISAAPNSGGFGLNSLSPFSSALSVANPMSALPGAMPSGSPMQQIQMIMGMMMQMVSMLLQSFMAPQGNPWGNASGMPSGTPTMNDGGNSPYGPPQSPSNAAFDSPDTPDTPDTPDMPGTQELPEIPELPESESGSPPNQYNGHPGPTAGGGRSPSNPTPYGPSPTPKAPGPTPYGPSPSPQTPGPTPYGPSPTGTGSPPGNNVGPTGPVSNTQPPNSINPKEFGAKGDGSSDDQAALQKAFDKAKATGQSVWIPPGTYNHSGVLNIDGVKVSGAGNKTILNATNPDQEAIKLTGNNSSISNLKTTVQAGGRSSMPDAAAILVQNASNASVTNVTAQGAASNGIRVDNSTGTNISHDLVLGSNADGIALMNGSCNNKVSGNVVYQAGDDSYSDDSYTSDAKQDQNNIFEGNLSLANAYGRGMALAGSKNDIVRNNIISGSKWMGIFGDTDANSGTMQSSGHRIENNTVINNPNGPPVQASGSTVTGTKTSGSVPNLADILGWDPGQLIDRNTFTKYVPGTGSGANNSGGNRS